MRPAPIQRLVVERQYKEHKQSWWVCTQHLEISLVCSITSMHVVNIAAIVASIVQTGGFGINQLVTIALKCNDGLLVVVQKESVSVEPATELCLLATLLTLATLQQAALCLEGRTGCK